MTPVYNTKQWIRETIESVLSQAGDFEIEYVIRDGKSTDGTLEIIREYHERIETETFPINCKKITMRITSEKDGGMYSAINHGFAQATGDIYSWINADDRYEPGAFARIQTAFESAPEIQWVKGTTSTINEAGEKIRPGACNLYRRTWLAQGIYGQEAYFVEQDSVFWRAGLWKTAGPIPSHLRFAGDYWLWIAFAKHAPLWSLNTPISSFRKRQGQLSKDVQAYKGEQGTIRPHRTLTAWRSRLFFSAQSRLSRLIPSIGSVFPKIYPFFFPEQHFSYLELVGDQITKREIRTYLAPSSSTR